MINNLKNAFVFTCISAVCGCNATAENLSFEIDNTSSNFVTKTIHQKQEKSAKPNINSEQKVSLTIEQIMSDPDWIGRQPESAYFSPMGDSVLYFRKREGSLTQDLYKTNDGLGNGEKVSLSTRHTLEYDEIINKSTHNFVAWIYKGNVFAQKRGSTNVMQLTMDSDTAKNLNYYLENGVSFQKGNGFYTIDIISKQYKQVLEWKFAEQEDAVKPPKDYIAQEQQKLIEFVQIQRKNALDKRAHEDSLKNDNSSIMVSSFYFDKNHTNLLASLSPNGKYAVVVTRENTSTRGEGDIMPDYIEENGRIKAQAVRQRVADAKPISHSVFFIDIARKTKKKISYKTLSGYNEDVLADVKRENAKANGKEYVNNRLPRDIGLLFDWYATEMPVKWHSSSEQVALMLEAWDNKDRWIVTIDVDKPKFKVQHRMHDKAWINYRFNKFDWFTNTKTLYFLSEESGYSQIYTKAIDGELSTITSGKFVVDNVTLTDNDEYFFYKANKKHPGIYEVYKTKFDGSQTYALTNLNGLSDFVLSPNEEQLLLTHSTLAMPPELYLASAKEESEAIKLTSTVSEAFLSIDWTVPSIVAVKSSHTSQPIYSRVYTPNIDDSAEKRKAVVFTHGAGYLQNSHLGWSNYFREFMFHSLLVSKGYVVLDMDYRASAGYGRDWRTAIYRNMGTPEVQDLRDGINWLVDNANVDRQRVGTYGGSYGGFLTFMSMFKEPDLFQAGAALRPVTDWAHYNLPYTANILNTPNVDPLAYERSSPIYYAEGLSKPLLINAPMVDNNVFFVDVVRLVQRLIELEKENFETAIYPVEAHGFVQPSSWLDEYRRIYKLFETNL